MSATHLCKIVAAPDPNADREDVSYDIHHMKLYLDMNTGQFKTRLICSGCGQKCSCRCYSSLEDAVFYQSEREEVLCDSCFMAEGYDEWDIENGDFDVLAGEFCGIGGDQE
ncbi:hypothetical protein FTO70_03780 [Methanosarcina sp. KYL-1]|uniref:hypothetical protein n=1 Tax=Methanosarcina sp. KYL-1 TaxID=2602068 RepID=UPI002100E3AE|nr:hypothetical protein [Methanosarcina sp. KYL-1]MCQ1534823.1 hypothetical protein [Methanosarcina sp. KYL-1]